MSYHHRRTRNRHRHHHHRHRRHQHENESDVVSHQAPVGQCDAGRSLARAESAVPRPTISQKVSRPTTLRRPTGVGGGRGDATCVQDDAPFPMPGMPVTSGPHTPPQL